MDKAIITTFLIVSGLILALFLVGFGFGWFFGVRSSVTSPRLVVDGSEVVGWGDVVYFHVLMPAGLRGSVVRVFTACNNASLNLLNATSLEPLTLPYVVSDSRLAVVVPSNCSVFCVVVSTNKGVFTLCS